MDSLIQREEQQPTLPGDWSPDVLERIEAEESHGHFTGDRLYIRRPEIYRAVVQLLGQGVGVRQIARTLGVSTNTVSAVRLREGSSIETHKIRAAESLSSFVAAAADRLRDEVHDIAIDKLSVPLGIAVEKLMLLTGQATSRVEHIDAAPAPVDFGQYLESLPTVQAVAMGNESETNLQKGQADEADTETGSRGTDGHPTGPYPAATDFQSVVLPRTRAAATVSATALAHSDVGNGDGMGAENRPVVVVEQGGGGGRLNFGGGSCRDAMADAEFEQRRHE